MTVGKSCSKLDMAPEFQDDSQREREKEREEDIFSAGPPRAASHAECGQPIDVRPDLTTRHEKKQAVCDQRAEEHAVKPKGR